jgi:hypothetical protein
MQTDELIAYIFERKPPTPQFAHWLNRSKRFKTFVETYRDKIRKKVRYVENHDGLLDLTFELEMAYRLLNEPRFTLEYEKYTATKQRGPDYTVSFRTHVAFNVEVRRIRSLDDSTTIDENVVITRLTDAVCDKVRQMPPSIVNLLALTSGAALSESVLINAMLLLRKRAEGKDEAFFTRRGFDSAADFIRHYHRLSGILYHWNGTLIVWANPLAKHPLAREIANALSHLSRNHL